MLNEPMPAATKELLARKADVVMTAFSKPIQLQEGCGIEDFECGDPVVDLWVARHSSSSRKRGTAVVYVSYSDEKAAGFYTLSTHSVARLSVTGGWFTGTRPIPCPRYFWE